jgi:hypothetical protein
VNFVMRCARRQRDPPIPTTTESKSEAREQLSEFLCKLLFK